MIFAGYNKRHHPTDGASFFADTWDEYYTKVFNIKYQPDYIITNKPMILIGFTRDPSMKCRYWKQTS